MEYNAKYGQKITKEIKKGTAIHDELESEVNVPIILEPKNYADALYKTVYTSFEAVKALKAKKKTREVQLYGSLSGYKVVGKMDQLEIKDGSVVITEDKTRANGNIPSDAQQLVHKIQLMVYRKLLGDIHDGEYGFNNFKVAYGIGNLTMTEEFKRQLTAINVAAPMQDIAAVSKDFFYSMKNIGNVSETLHIRYINQYTGEEIKTHKFEYKKEEMQDIIKYIMKYWNGERESMPVPENEAWKCNFCVFFGKECKVWWKQRAL
jgi:exonuclease V